MAISGEKFHDSCAANDIPRDAYTGVAGFYEDTLKDTTPGALLNNIALAYIDCDLYSSTRTVLEFLMPRLKHGMIIAIDDYFCWSATHVSGERQAMLEFFHNNTDWELVPYMLFSWGGQSFVVESRRIVGYLRLASGPRAQENHPDLDYTGTSGCGTAPGIHGIDKERLHAQIDSSPVRAAGTGYGWHGAGR